jgi:hypothetical protein
MGVHFFWVKHYFIPLFFCCQSFTINCCHLDTLGERVMKKCCWILGGVLGLVKGDATVAEFDTYITNATTALTGNEGVYTLVGSATSTSAAISTKVTTVNTELGNASGVVQRKSEPEPDPVIATAWYGFCSNAAVQLAGVESLFRCGPRNSAVFRGMLQANVNAIQSAIGAAKAGIRAEVEIEVVDHPEFDKYLQDEGTTIDVLSNQTNTLVLIQQRSMPSGTDLSAIEHLFLVLTYPTFDIAQCTELKTFGFFDSSSGLNSDQRDNISSLVTGQKKLQNLIVMNWGGVEIAGSAFCGTGSGDNSGSLVQVVIHKATGIGSTAFRYCQKLTTVSIPDAGPIGAEGDGSATGAFANCNVLKTVDIPKAEGIGGYAFYCCRALQAVSFPKVTGSIGKYAFGECYALQAASFPKVKTIGTASDFYGVFEGCRALQAASFPVAESIGKYAFYNCYALQAASFPEVTGIGDNAFYNCYALRMVIYPQTATVSGTSFDGCHSDLKQITTNFSSYLGWDLISPRADEILTLTNAGNVSDSQLNVIRHLYLVGQSNPLGLNISTRNKLLSLTFTNCANLLETQCNDIGSIKGYLQVLSCNWFTTTLGTTLQGSRTLTTVIMNNVLIIEGSAFSGCTALRTVDFQNVTAIGSEAFKGCYALRAASFPEVTGSIGSQAFNQCYALQAASFPKVTGSIGSYAFAGCFALQTASFPKVGSIGSSAFQSCSALQEIVYPSTASLTGGMSGVFSGCLKSIKILNPSDGSVRQIGY